MCDQTNEVKYKINEYNVSMEFSDISQINASNGLRNRKTHMKTNIDDTLIDHKNEELISDNNIISSPHRNLIISSIIKFVPYGTNTRIHLKDKNFEGYSCLWWSGPLPEQIKTGKFYKFTYKIKTVKINPHCWITKICEL